jgi:hypothetical protein
MNRSVAGIAKAFTGLVLAAGMAVPLSAASATSAQAAGPTITSVTFKGPAAKPTVIIKGSGFGTKPVADPSSHPNGQAACPAFPTSPAKDIKDDGYDYGTNVLWIEDNTSGWRAGNYVSGGEIDCIGLRISSWKATEIKFKLGTAYDNIALEGHTYILSSGDQVEVDVSGTTSTTTY